LPDRRRGNEIGQGTGAGLATQTLTERKAQTGRGRSLEKVSTSVFHDGSLRARRKTFHDNCQNTPMSARRMDRLARIHQKQNGAAYPAAAQLFRNS
jgi:hypothetical protein